MLLELITVFIFLTVYLYTYARIFICASYLGQYYSCYYFIYITTGHLEWILYIYMKKVHTNVKCLYLMSPIQCEPTFRLIRTNVYIQKHCIPMHNIIMIGTITDSFLSFPNVAYVCFECACCM